jgi:poly-gamma-glutamate capsule biosynthesis protein CapA/YwtB (metallophosphatase superfamily)
MDRRTLLKALGRAAAAVGAARLTSLAPRALAGEAPEPDRPTKRSDDQTRPALAGEAPAPDRSGDRLSLALVGDCLIARRISRLKDPDFLAVRALLAGADLAWGNCEQVFADPQKVSPAPKGEDPVAICPVWGAEELRAMGIGLVGTANNHALDYGTEGLFSTWAELDRAGIAHGGTGLDLAQAARPAYADTAAGRVADVNCASTFPDFFAAGPAHPWVKGRPGINPLKIDYTVQLERPLFARLKKEQQRLDELQGTGEFAEMIADEESRQPPGTALFWDLRIAPGEATDIVPRARPEDVTRVTESIRAARSLARVVIASIHAHEARERLDRPDLFLQPFARACLDAGADLFVGAGPHVLRGIELYRGKPIFYSLGDFFFQYESELQVPAEALAVEGLDPRTLDTWQYHKKIFYWKQRRFWQSAVPRLTFAGERLAEVELHPITLGFGEPLDRRGTPRLAHGEEARSILEGLAGLSAPYGTRITIDGEVGRLQLA